MAFRFLLVGMVSCFGLDLPQSCDLDGCLRSGRAWVEARAFELQCQLSTAETPDTPTTCPAAASLDDDLAFSTLVNEIVTEFAEPAQENLPLASIYSEAATLPEAEEAPAHSAPFVSVEEPALTGQPIPVPLGVEIESILAQPKFPDLPENVWQEDPVLVQAPEPPAPSTPRVDRLAQAIRLTGQAMQAWLALVSHTEATIPTE